jgi:EthD domain
MTKGLPGPWVDYEAADPTPWASNQGIVKFIEFPVRIPAMSRRAFHLYWMKHHSPNVMNVTPFAQFMRKYTTTHAYPEGVPGLPAHYRQTSHLEGAAEVWINSLDEVGDWLGHPLYAELVQPDEPRFIAQDGSVEVIVAKEERLYEPERDMTETGMAKLFLLVAKRPNLDHDTFHAAASAYGKQILQRPALRSLLRRLVVSHKLREPALEGFVPADIDAVLELWFQSLGDIAAFYAEESFDEPLRRHEEQFFDAARIRAVAGKMLVIHDEFSFQPSTMQPLVFTWDDDPF